MCCNLSHPVTTPHPKDRGTGNAAKPDMKLGSPASGFASSMNKLHPSFLADQPMMPMNCGACFLWVTLDELQTLTPTPPLTIVSRIHQKEGLVQILVTEKLRSLGDQRQQPRAETETPPATPPPTTPMPTPAATVSPPRPSPPPSPSSGGSEHKRASYDGGGPEWTPPPETWTEAEFGGGDGRGARRDRVARVTGEGTVVPMIRIRPR